ncbi:prephenate dehydrogenase [Corynebacterium qintianiae]|uniref:prephenate dehydrogenase n=1 Tax=Corynebacterium qintianiae TaxID=2709392 RepID=UPI0022A70F6F|nr:prephenate dehydrogenase [Corynebacterium qintianiae]
MTSSPNYLLPPVCILGLGLIGGSLMRDLSARGERVYGYNRSRSATRAAQKEGFGVSSDLAETLARASGDNALLVVAVPMDAVAEVLDAVAEHAPHCGITDVVSVKKPVYDLVRARGLEGQYVGGHPMSGTENSGWGASQEGLFHRAAWAVTYDWADELDAAGTTVPESWSELFTQVCALAALTGAEAVPVSVGRHDEAVARVSHLPHVIAEALAIVGDHGGTLAQSLAAGSFKGATRVAGTDPSLVRNMCETNAEALVPVLDEYLTLLTRTRDSLSGDNPSIQSLAEAGNRAYVRMGARSGARRESVSPVKISSRPVMRVHPGGPGWVKQLKQIEALGGRVEVF